MPEKKPARRLVPHKLKLDWGRVRIWGPSQEELAEPGDLAGRECKVRCELRQVWVMSNQCGLLLEVTDLQLKEGLRGRRSGLPLLEHAQEQFVKQLKHMDMVGIDTYVTCSGEIFAPQCPVPAPSPRPKQLNV